MNKKKHKNIKQQQQPNKLALNKQNIYIQCKEQTAIYYIQGS